MIHVKQLLLEILTKYNNVIVVEKEARELYI